MVYLVLYTGIALLLAGLLLLVVALAVPERRVRLMPWGVGAVLVAVVELAVAAARSRG